MHLVVFWQILLQKWFWVLDQKISERWTRFSCMDVGRNMISRLTSAANNVVKVASEPEEGTLPAIRPLNEASHPIPRVRVFVAHIRVNRWQRGDHTKSAEAKQARRCLTAVGKVAPDAPGGIRP